jgi:hypothetical protein
LFRVRVTLRPRLRLTLTLSVDEAGGRHRLVDELVALFLACALLRVRVRATVRLRVRARAGARARVRGRVRARVRVRDSLTLLPVRSLESMKRAISSAGRDWRTWEI